jgi:hypothetical protein
MSSWLWKDAYMNRVTPKAVQVDLVIPTIHPMPLIDTGEQGSDCALSVGYVCSIYCWNDDALRHVR